MKRFALVLVVLFCPAPDAHSEESFPLAIQMKVGGESLLQNNGSTSFKTGIGIGAHLDQEEGGAYRRLKAGMGIMLCYGNLTDESGEISYFDAASQAWLAWDAGGWYLGGRLAVTMRVFSDHTHQWGVEAGGLLIVPLGSWFSLAGHLDYLFFLPGDAAYRHQPAHALSVSAGPMFVL
jgi:hypothetical protein